ncbi:ribonuclease H-like domain-containing protein [Tanacetum coccineum]
MGKTEVIKNGNKVLKGTVGEIEQEYEPTTAEEKQDKRNEMKARGTLLMALPNKDQLKFHSYKDSKLLMEAIDKSTNSNSNTNEADNTAYGVSAAHTQSNPKSGDKLSNAEIAMLNVRARRFIRGWMTLDGNVKGVGFGYDMSKVECYNCHKNGHFAREYRCGGSLPVQIHRWILVSKSKCKSLCHSQRNNYDNVFQKMRSLYDDRVPDVVNIILRVSVASDDLRDALSVIFGLSELKCLFAEVAPQMYYSAAYRVLGVLQIALSRNYISDSDPEEDDEEDPEEDHADYPADGGDNDDNESSNDDNDDDDVRGWQVRGGGGAPSSGDLCYTYKSDCPELKNQNHENGGTRARRVVHALGGGETNQDHNDMEEDINA